MRGDGQRSGWATHARGRPKQSGLHGFERNRRWPAKAGALFVLAVIGMGALTTGSAVADEGPIVEGPRNADQSPTSTNETSYTTATPTPVAASGSVGTVAREVWSAEEIDSENDLAIVTSTAAGTFALTGVVQDEVTGAPVGGATVSLRGCSGCAPLV
jgi:hypothetical protein